MSITPPENGTPGSSPIYDETIATPTFDDLRVPPPGFEDDLDTVGGQGSGGAAQTAKDRAQQTTGAAKDAASDVAGTAKDAGAKVASTGKEQASRVAKDAMGQARDLYGQATSQLSEQAGTQQQKAAGTLHTFADDLGNMGSSADGGLAAELVQNLETRTRDIADWLEQHSPEDALDEVKRFAARRPGVFIGLAAVTGIVAARLTKALVAEAKDSAEPDLDGSAPGGIR
jgi:gas vesicle protein